MCKIAPERQLEKVGRVPAQMATAWTSHAVSGAVTKSQARAKSLFLDQRPRLRRHFIGIAQRNVTKGRERTSNGAEMSMRISCCTMCAANKASPSGCNGEMR